MTIHIHNHHHVGSAGMPQQSQGADGSREPGVDGLKKLLQALESDGQGSESNAQAAQQEQQLGKIVMQVVQMIQQMMGMGMGMLGLGR